MIIARRCSPERDQHRRRRVKTDRLDCEKLASMLVRYSCGDERIRSVVRVPSFEAEDNRQPTES